MVSKVGSHSKSRVPIRSFPFLFYNFLGSHGARFRTVRTGSSATPLPAKPPFRQPPGATGAAQRRVAEGTTPSPGSLTVAFSNGLIDRGRSGILNLPLQPVLLGAPSSRLLVEKLLGEPTVELVHVHRLDARFDPLVPGLELLDGLRARRLLSLVRVKDGATEPFEDGMRKASSL